VQRTIFVEYRTSTAARVPLPRTSFMPSLFDPLRVGDLDLPNRIIMAPLTRARATDARVPTPLMRDYYVQRAAAGLILSEATSVTPMGVGYADTPGIWSAEQIVGWRAITDAVHAAGGRMFLQLWHVGRISDPVFLGDNPPVAPSAIAARGEVSLLRPKRPFPLPHALTTEEVKEVVAVFRQGAENAQAAGFDGVELHGANGYLLDQFLQDGSNHRDDEYGGPVENRARLLLEATDAAIAVWGAGRVGVHLAPRGDAHDMGDSDPAGTFGHVARELGRRGVAFLCAREHDGPDRLGPSLRAAFGGPFIANEGFTPETAAADVQEGRSDAVAFGKLFIANPDLPARLLAGAPLNAWRADTFYGGGAAGYTDYPAMQREAA
jgi:2,4-dienoyl-CoA reductase-like NADH-dependent reductase (Old Yellow Enzyme family)